MIVSNVCKAETFIVVVISKLKFFLLPRSVTLWDKAPKGYEDITPVQFKAMRGTCFYFLLSFLFLQFFMNV